MFPKVLSNGLWHTTSLPHFNEILNTGHILAEPNIPNSERWNTKAGFEYYPYVRSLGGVSLFDFNDFNEIEYESKYPLSSWHTFVPCNPEWNFSVWIKINQTKLMDKLLCPKVLLSQWKEQEAFRRNIMPMIEAAYIGSIPVSYFESALLYSKEKKSFSELLL